MQLPNDQEKIKRRSFWGVLVFLCFLLSCSLQEKEQPSEMNIKQKVTRTISQIDFVDRELQAENLSEAIGKIRQFLRKEKVPISCTSPVAEENDPPIDIQKGQYTLIEVFDKMAQQSGCVWEIDEYGAVHFKKGDPLTTEETEKP